MSSCVIAALAQDPELHALFQEDPIEALKRIKEITGSDQCARISYNEIELIRNLTKEEFEMFYGVIDRMKKLNIPNFKI